MIFLQFIKLRWKEATRSNIWQRNVAANIGIGFLMLIMMSYLLMLGLFIDPILEQLYPDEDPVVIFNSILVYYFLADLFIRYMMQALPTFNIESFLHLPVKRTRVVHFIMARTGLHLLNFLPLLVFIPFALTTLKYSYSSLAVTAWTVSVMALIFMNGFLATWLKRQLVARAWITGLAALLIVLAGIMDYFGVIRLTVLSTIIFQSIIASPWLTVIPVTLMFIFYMIQYGFLLARMYPDEIIKRKSYESSDIPRIRYLESLGLTGDLMMLEMKLWWRHRRTKSMLYLLPVFILYGFFFYPQEEYKSQPGWLIFVGLFMTGGFMMNYLNYAFGYESNYFDGILTRKIDMKRYIRAKLTIAMLLTTFCFIITVPYVFFGFDILLINLATFLFNIGFLSFLMTYMATYNKMRMDLSKAATFNYQGVSALNWLIMIPAFLLPVLIYVPFGWMGYKYAGLAIIAMIGIAGFIFKRYLTRRITEHFFERKYIMAEGFRGN